MLPRSGPDQEEFQWAFDPETDTVYDLRNRVSKRLIFQDRNGVPLTNPSQTRAQLFQMWNAGAAGLSKVGPAHPQVTLAEAIGTMVSKQVKEEGKSPTDVLNPFSSICMQFAFGIGLFMARRGVTLDVQANRMTEAQVLEVRKKFMQ